MKIKYLTVLLIVILSCNQQAKEIPSLREKYEPFFPIGAAIGQKHLKNYDTVLVPCHFASITAENDMKPGRTINENREYTFNSGDKLVDFAREHGLMVRGHTLVWYNQTPDWFYRDEAGEYLSKDSLFTRLKNYIHNVLDHYKGAVYCWDVVNEAISDYHDRVYRDDIDWYKVCGPEYIEKAFIFAREADPDVKLFYNDYDLINPHKRDKTYRVLKELLEKGVPIVGVGMQGHWTLEDVNREVLSAAIDSFSSLGLEVQITELDISVYPYYHKGISKNLC